MKEKSLSESKRERINELVKQWLEEAEPYLQGESGQKVPHLDGEKTTALAKIQMKYLNKIKEVSEGNLG